MKKHNIILGLFFIFAAAAVILSRTDIFKDIKIWSILISLLLIPVIISSIRTLDFWGIFFPLAIIAILYDKQLHIEMFTPFPVLISALCLSIGFSLIFPKGKYIAKHGENFSNMSSTWSESSAENIYIKSNFISTSKRITSNNLKKVLVECKFGKTDIYMSMSQIADDTATLSVNALCSSIKLYIPKSWNTYNTINNKFSETNIPSMSSNEYIQKKLILTGTSYFSSVKIIYV